MFHVTLLRLIQIRMLQTGSSPLIIVLGATGTGKSRFAIDLCRKLNGEVLSTDAMQTYRGLDIVTNKVTEEEARYCSHHLIGYLEPLEMSSSVINFRDKCLATIEDIRSRGRVPVIVGGTNYYIESVLWHFTLNVDVGETSETEETKKLSNSELHDRLMAVDSETASRIHPNDRRKVLHALRVKARCGVALSELHKEQRSKDRVDGKSGPLRYSNCIAFWLSCDRSVLNERLDRRTKKMLSGGLIEEIETFWKDHDISQRLKNGDVDFTKGILQSIGLRQFREYLELSDDDKKSEVGRAALEVGFEKMRVATRQYARRQDTWVINRFLKRSSSSVPPVYEVNVTQVEPPKRFDYDTDATEAEKRWSELVDRAVNIVQSVADPNASHKCSLVKPINAPTPGLATTEKQVDATRPTEFELNRCDVCDQVFVVKQVYQVHLNSKKHKYRVRAAKRASQEQKANHEAHQCTGSDPESEASKSDNTDNADVLDTADLYSVKSVHSTNTDADGTR